jgi:AmmeMemoRadiSam system protein B
VDDTSLTGEIRPAAVAGTWYPGSPGPLAAEVDSYLAAVGELPRLRRVMALIAPHAGLRYSGPVAAYAYEQLRDRDIDRVVLVGPSHFVGFHGVALCAHGAFDSPLGAAGIDAELAQALLAASPIIHEDNVPHRREHSLEMQLPFVRRVASNAKIVPLLVGTQTADTARQLGDALALIVRGERTLLVASTDLSHYEDAQTAQRLDAVVIEHVRRLDPEGLQAALDLNPHHACGGGPAVAVMRAARALGARDGVILNYADSGDVSGDKSAVVGYLAAAMGLA